MSVDDWRNHFTLFLLHLIFADFCEPNYLSQFYVAEPYNALSSLVFTMFGLIALLCCNPTNEWRFTVLHTIAIVIGIGSAALHSSLHWFFQSMDEVPMLWFNSAGCYCIYNNYTKVHPLRAVPDYSAYFAIAVTMLGTFIYYFLQSLYVVFITTYSVSMAVVVIWSYNYVFGKNCHKNKYESILKLLECLVIVSFFVVGLVSWLVDMNRCEQLLPLYRCANGITLHVLWHMGAGYGGYVMTLILVISRASAVDVPVEVTWLWFCCPIVSKKREDKL